MKLNQFSLSNLSGRLEALGRYRKLAFTLTVLLAYAFVGFQIMTLQSAEPSADTIASELDTIRAPKVDEAVVEQLKTLQDNNVNVKALFDDARSNPFKEPE